jgi:hypothetical protein
VSAAALEALEEAERAFNAAMVSNDPTQIAACITEDWVLVTLSVAQSLHRLFFRRSDPVS